MKGMNMNREDKYKVWDNYKKKVIENPFIVYDDGKLIAYLDWRDWEDGIPIKDAVISEYIGINDKNGKEIYEFDYIYVSGYSYIEPEEDWEGVVLKGNLGWFINGYNSSGDEAWYSLNEIGGSYTTIYENLGSTYEKPELLNRDI
jgi:hypothetical protein